MRRLGYVVSSHGYGHAARSCAVIEAIWRTDPDVHVTIFGRTPSWFFHQSLGRLGESGTYELVPLDTDVGLVQRSALREDTTATAEALRAGLPMAEACRPLADGIERSGADAVVCDISPWGLVAAHRLGLPSVLVENFTWDWIYAGYPDLADFEAPFRAAFDLATTHIQTAPICRPSATAHARTLPASRSPRKDRESTRAELGLGDDEQLVMMTMGGVAWRYQNLGALESESERVWVIAGGADGNELEQKGRHVLLPHRSPFYHPDLVAASDVVVGKLGYSTVAEVAAAGTRFVFVPRPHFPESRKLEAWTRCHLTSTAFEPERLEAKSWLSDLIGTVGETLQRPRRVAIPNAADQVAQRVLELF